MLYIIAQEVETIRQITTDKKLLDKQAKTDEPYKKILSKLEFPKIAAAPTIKIPVPKKNDDAIEMAKYFLKIIFKKTYKLAQPRLMIIFPSIAQIKEPKFTAKDNPTSNPAKIVPNKYVTHIQAIAKAQIIVLDII